MTVPVESCVQSAKGPLGTPEPVDNAPKQVMRRKETPIVRAQVGKPAPDFELSAFVDGGFKNVRLSDYKGK